MLVHHVLVDVHDFLLLVEGDGSALALHQVLLHLSDDRFLGDLTQGVRYLVEFAAQHVLLRAHLVDGTLHVPRALINWHGLLRSAQALTAARELQPFVRFSHTVHTHV